MFRKVSSSAEGGGASSSVVADRYVIIRKSLDIIFRTLEKFLRQWEMKTDLDWIILP
jgi:hypothetical protein